MWDPLQREILAELGHVPWMMVNPALPDDPLLHALLRAAGRDAGSPDAVQRVGQWPPLSQLRGDATAKRRLWPQLRRLRHNRPDDGSP